MPPPLDYQTPVAGQDRPPEPVKAINLLLIALAGVAYLITFGLQGGIGAIAFFFPFLMYPFAVNAIFAVLWKKSLPQVMLLIATLAYAGFVIFVYVDVVYLHPDPQGPIAFLFVGAFALPFLAGVWCVGWLLESRRRKE